MSYPPIYVINLKRNPERKLYIQRQLDALNLEYQFVEAIDKYDLISKASRTKIANQLDIDKVNMESLYDYSHHRHRIGPVACLLSHIKVYNLIIQNNIPYACVLEDDSDILPVFPKILTAAQKVPWDVLMLSSLTNLIHSRLLSGFSPFRLRSFYKLICYRKYYPQLNSFTVRLLTLKLLKFSLIILQYKILKTISSKLKPKYATHLGIASEIGGLPNKDKHSWHKVTSMHYIATPYYGESNNYPNVTSGMAYMLTRSAAIKWKQRAIFRDGNPDILDAIDSIPFKLYIKKELNLYILFPPCVRATTRYLRYSPNTC